MSVWKKLVLVTVIGAFAIAGQAMTENKKANKFFTKAMEAVQKSDLEKAEVQFTKALEQDPAFYEAHLEYGRMLALNGRYDEAKQQLNQAMDMAPAEDLTAIGLLYAIAREENNLDDQAAYTILKLEKLGDKATPNDIGRVDAIGVTFAQNGQMEKAESTYRKLIELHPEYAYGYLNLGKIFLFMQKDQKKAVATFEQAVEKGIDNEEMDYILGMIYHDADQYEKALPLLKKALGKTEYRKDVLPMVINCQITLEDLEGAKASCETYLDEFPASESRKQVQDRLDKIENNLKVLAEKDAGAK